MAVQLAIQAALPPGEALVEHPFIDFDRVADVLWEKQKVIFEVQCSLLNETEVQQRIEDYGKAGYRIVWILDDLLFNKRRLRPAEKLMRSFTSYYVQIRTQSTPIFYDQFEIFAGSKRKLRGHKLRVALASPKLLSKIEWDLDCLPTQVQKKSIIGTLYFYGDLIYRSSMSHRFPLYLHSLLSLQALEIQYREVLKWENSFFRKLLLTCILEPLGLFFLWLAEKTASHSSQEYPY